MYRFLRIAAKVWHLCIIVLALCMKCSLISVVIWGTVSSLFALGILDSLESGVMKFYQGCGLRRAEHNIRFWMNLVPIIIVWFIVQISFVAGLFLAKPEFNSSKPRRERERGQATFLDTQGEVLEGLLHGSQRSNSISEFGTGGNPSAAGQG